MGKGNYSITNKIDDKRVTINISKFEGEFPATKKAEVVHEIEAVKPEQKVLMSCLPPNRQTNIDIVLKKCCIDALDFSDHLTKYDESILTESNCELIL